MTLSLFVNNYLKLVKLHLAELGYRQGLGTCESITAFFNQKHQYLKFTMIYLLYLDGLDLDELLSAFYWQEAKFLSCLSGAKSMGLNVPHRLGTARTNSRTPRMNLYTWYRSLDYALTLQQKFLRSQREHELLSEKINFEASLLSEMVKQARINICDSSTEVHYLRLAENARNKIIAARHIYKLSAEKCNDLSQAAKAELMCSIETAIKSQH